MKFELNYKNVEYLKNNIDIFDIIGSSNKNIINDLFNDDDEFVVNDEIFVDVDDDEFIENIYLLCIINNFKGSININDDVDEILKYELYNRFNKFNYNSSFIIIDYFNNLNDDDKKYYYVYNKPIINNCCNIELMNFIYNLLNSYDIFIDNYYYNIDDIDVDIKNLFLIDTYDIDDIFKHDNKLNYIKNYNELFECIVIYDDVDVFIDEYIDEFVLNECNEFIKPYIDKYELYNDIIDDYIYDEYDVFNNTYVINQYYF